MSDQSPRILLIGSLPPPLGGTGVLFESLIRAVGSHHDVAAAVINTGQIRGRWLTGPWRLLKVLWQMMRGVARTDVVTLHAATSGLHLVGPLVCALARLWRKPLILRKFGGTDYRSLGAVRRALIRSVVRRANLFFVETRALIDAARDDGVANVEWFPNHRDMTAALTQPPRKITACRRFVFIGQVRPVKGIAELISAAERCGDDVAVDVYGPFFDGLSEEAFAGLKRIHYRGVLQPAQVLETLRRYDVLVLPTYHPGEGYPGIILEAYGAELPVITTNWRAVPEIVDDTCGLLVEPRNADALYEAMKRLMTDDELYQNLCTGARAKREFFDTQTWAARFVEHCRTLANAGV